MRFRVLGAGQRLKAQSDDTTFENRRSFEYRSSFENRITFEKHLRISKTLKNNYKNNKSYYSTLTLLIKTLQGRENRSLKKKNINQIQRRMMSFRISEPSQPKDTKEQSSRKIIISIVLPICSRNPYVRVLR